MLKQKICLVLGSVLLMSSLVSCAKKEEDTGYEMTVIGTAETYTDRYVIYEKGGRMHYFDVSSGEDSVYCDDPSCQHIIPDPFDPNAPEPTCTAVILSEAEGIAIRNNQLYFIRDKDGNWSDKELVRANKSGKEQKVVTDYDSVQHMTTPYYIEEKLFVPYYKDCDMAEVTDEGSGETYMTQGDKWDHNEIGIYYTNLETGESRLLTQKSGYSANIYSMYYQDEMLYYLMMYTDIYIDFEDEDVLNNWEYQVEHSRMDLYRINLADSSEECLLSGATASGVGFANGCFYYCYEDATGCYGGEKGVYQKNLTDGTVTKVCDPYGNSFMECDGKVLFLHYENETDHYLLYDPDKGEIVQDIVLPEKFRVMAVFPNTVYGFVITEDGSSANALVPAKDFLEGNLDNMQKYRDAT